MQHERLSCGYVKPSPAWPVSQDPVSPWWWGPRPRELRKWWFGAWRSGLALAPPSGPRNAWTVPYPTPVGSHHQHRREEVPRA